MKTHDFIPLTMRLTALTAALGAAMVPSACGGDELKCGPGTEKQGKQCISRYGLPDGGGGSGGGTGDSGVVDTIVFGGVTAAAPANQPGIGTPDAVLVTWRPASYPLLPNALLHYEIFTATTSGAQSFSTPAQIAPPGATSAIVEGLDSAAPTYFVVRAVANAGTAVDTNTVERSTTPAADANAPTFGGAVSAVGAGSSSVTVTWDAATDDHSAPEAITYQVFWSETTTGTPRFGAISYPGDTQVVVEGLPAADTTYYFTVIAVDAAGNATTPGAAVSGKTALDTVPPVFGGCRATANPAANGGLVVWDPAADDVTPASRMKYRIYAIPSPVDENTAFATPDAEVSGASQGVVGGLDSATTYRIVCRAVDETGNEDQNRNVALLQTLSDGNPPVFGAGSASAVAKATTIDVTWPAATDDKTAAADIQYNVYAATSPGAQDMTKPTSTWIAGAATVFGTMVTKTELQLALPASDTSGKVSNKDWYLIVTAKDQAGNETSPLPEVHVTTLVSLNDDVQDIFDVSCALSGCHVHPTPIFNPPQGQVLERTYTYNSVVNVVAGEGVSVGEPNIKRVDSTSSDPRDSYLWRKINGGGTIVMTDGGPDGGIRTFPEGIITGSPMPPLTSTGPQLTDAQKTIIKTWIIQGAGNN